MSDGELTAPAEGSASTPDEIADELCEVLTRFAHVDYNALTSSELRALLDARSTVEELCLDYRRASTRGE
jgi:hypothetical protein